MGGPPCIDAAFCGARFRALGAALASATTRANAATEAEPQGKLKVVYHLSDLDKVNFVLGNIQNHFDGVGGPDNVTIALVVHGQALRAFHAASANPDLGASANFPRPALNSPPAATP